MMGHFASKLKRELTMGASLRSVTGMVLLAMGMSLLSHSAFSNPVCKKGTASKKCQPSKKNCTVEVSLVSGEITVSPYELNPEELDTPTKIEWTVKDDGEEIYVLFMDPRDQFPKPGVASGKKFTQPFMNDAKKDYPYLLIVKDKNTKMLYVCDPVINNQGGG